jgi:hypothetical protein
VLIILVGFETTKFVAWRLNYDPGIG